jgi:hypothetical protein
MKIQQTFTARLIPPVFKPLKHGLILGAAILVPATGSFAEEVASWTFATDSGKPTSSGAPVVSAESTPANEWPLTPTPKDLESPLVYKESFFDSLAQYPIMVEFPNVKPDLRAYLHNAEFNSLVGIQSWRIDMEVTFETVSAAVLLEIGGTERGSLRVMKQFKSGLRINQFKHFDANIEGIVLEPKKPYKISLIKEGKMLSLEINGEPHEVSSESSASSAPGISIGGPITPSYGTLVGAISAIRIENTEAAP